jgi:hypothetical protein
VAVAGWETVEAAAEVMWATAEVTGALARDTVAAVDETAEVAGVAELVEDLAGLTLEVAGEVVWLALVVGDAEWLTPEVTWATAEVTPFRVVVTAPVTVPIRPPAGAGVVEVAAARVTVEAWALVPDRSQNAAINPKQQPRSTMPRRANRPAQSRPGVTCASGAVRSTLVHPPMTVTTAT